MDSVNDAVAPSFLTTEQSFDAIPPPPEQSDRHRKHISEGDKFGGRNFNERVPISEDEVRDALLREAQRHSCWKTSAVRRMNISNIESNDVLHYTLESFTESRSTTAASEPYSLGQFIENQSSLIANSSSAILSGNPWDYDVQPSEDFVEQVRVLEMPGTSRLAACASCNTDGVSHCFHCRGFGTEKCSYCRGTGMKAGIAHPAVYTHPMIGTYSHADSSRGYQGSTSILRPPFGLAYGVGTPIHFMAKAGVPPPGIGTHDLCYFCHGRGVRECYHCKGRGKKTCGTCGGSGSVRTFIKLRVKFAVDRSEVYINQGIPEKLLAGVSGQLIFAECHDYVLPLSKYPLAEVNEQSMRLCQVHLQKALGSYRIIKQRHLLQSIPIARVSFRLGRRDGTFWVYGQEHMCHVPDYPAKCTLI